MFRLIKRQLPALIVLAILTLGLIALISQIERIKLFFSHANLDNNRQIFIYLSRPGQKTSDFWHNLAQGGEDNKPMLAKVSSQLSQTQPGYIRLDHIYDNYQTVTGIKDGNLELNWQLLDQAVDQILSTGAKPLLALSYFPPQITKNRQPTGRVKNWQLWQTLVNETISHFSNQRNINNVIYEVWNEPNLFGKFKMSGSNSYVKLYQETVSNLPLTQTNYLIGGPAWSYLNKKDFSNFLKEVKSRQLRLDFFSYHSYQFKPEKISQEFSLARQILSQNGFANLPIFVTEWGLDGNLNSKYDNNFGYWHTLATIIQTTPLVRPQDKFFLFEIKDGASPSRQQFWGRWGLFTNEAYGLVPKPRWFAWQQLSQLPWQRYTNISVDKPLSTVMVSNQRTSQFGLIITNNGNQVLVNHLHFRFMANGLWQFDSYRGPAIKEAKKIVITNNSFDYSLPLQSLSGAVFKLNQIDNLSRAKGRSLLANDYSLNLINGYRLKISPAKSNQAIWLSFWLKYDQLPNKPVAIFQLKSNSNQINLSWLERNSKLSLKLVNNFNLSSNSIPIDSLVADRWYKLEFVLNAKNQLGLSLKTSTSIRKLDIDLNNNGLDKTWQVIFRPNPRVDIDDIVFFPQSTNQLDKIDFNLD